MNAWAVGSPAAAKDDLVPAEPIGGALWESRTDRGVRRDTRVLPNGGANIRPPPRPPVFHRAATNVFNGSSCDFTVVAGSVQSDRAYLVLNVLQVFRWPIATHSMWNGD